MKYTSLLLLFLTSVYLRAQKPDYSSQSLHLSWGKENYTGKPDLSAKVKVNSVGEKLVIEVDVADDKLVIKNDPIHSDHVELWFALPSPDTGLFDKSSPDQPPVYYYDSVRKDDKTLYHFYSQFPPKVSDEDNDTILKGNVFYGIVHYGIFPDNRAVEMYDKQNYLLLEKALGEKIGHVAQGIQYKAEPTKTGVKYSVTISPLGLGFVKVPEMKEIFFRIDVADVDGDKRESVLSSSEDCQKPFYHTFTPIILSRPFRTNVTTVPGFVFDTLRFRPTVMFTDKGYWSCITRDVTCLNEEEDPCKSLETGFFRTPFGYKKWILGKEEIFKFTKNSRAFMPAHPSVVTHSVEEIYFIDKKKFTSEREENEWEFRDLNKEFLFPDGSIGLILVHVFQGHGNGPCGGSAKKDLEIVRIKGNDTENVFNISFDACGDKNSIGDKQVGDLLIRDIKWVKEGEALQIISEQSDDHQIRKFRVNFKGNKVMVVEEKERVAAKPAKK